MTTNRTSNLDEILGIANPTLATDNLNNHIDLIDNTPTTAINDSPTPRQKWSDNPKMRLAISAAVTGAIVIPLVGFYTLFGQLKTAIQKGKTNTTIKTTRAVEVDPELESTENLRGIIALGKQKDAIAQIENLSPEPKPEPEIKLESLPQVKPTPAPKPIAKPPAPRPQPRSISRSIPKPSIKPVAPAKPKYDSMDKWQQLAQLGSYGNKSSTKSTGSRITSVSDRLKNSYQEASYNRVQEELPPILAVNYESPTELTLAEAEFLEALQTANEPKPEPAAKLGTTIALAQQVKGKINTPVNWASAMKQAQTSFIELKEDLLDNRGEIAISKGTTLIYQIDSLASGIVRGQVTAALIDGQQIAIPQGAITIGDKKGNLLTAKYKEINNVHGNQDLLNFALGAAKQTSDLLATPDSSFFSVSSLGQSSGQSYDEKNYAGSAIAGGVEQMLENRTRELESRAQNRPATSFWQVKAGSDVTIQTNFNFTI